MDRLSITHKVRNKATELGFQGCGFSMAQQLENEAIHLEKWLSKGLHGEMKWMENHFDKRIDPRKLVEGSKSVISVFMTYKFEENVNIDNQSYAPKIAKYAKGRDYHKVIKKKLHHLIEFLQTEIGDIQARAFVDSAPVMDKAWAARSGLGWLGKNGNILTRESGSWILLGEILTDVEFVYDGPTTDHCGSCTRCIDACPTQAIPLPSVIDSRKCISYLTIELEQRIPSEFHQKMHGWAFGCDICQDVCPWNRKSALGSTDDLKPKAFFSTHSYEAWNALSKDEFSNLFRGTPLMRSGFEKMKENVKISEVSLRNGQKD